LKGLILGKDEWMIRLIGARKEFEEVKIRGILKTKKRDWY
jgi:hypothetical protein